MIKRVTVQEIETNLKRIEEDQQILNNNISSLKSMVAKYVEEQGK